jgi:tetratricopeptide (TPR) repeat protein
LTNIAGCYQFLRRYDEAIPLYRRALEIYEDLLGPIHADVAVTTNDLAVLYFTTGNTDQAEKLYKKALNVYEKIFGPHHPDVGQVTPSSPQTQTPQRVYSLARDWAKLNLLSWPISWPQHRGVTTPTHRDATYLISHFSLLYRYVESYLICLLDVRACCVRVRQALSNLGEFYLSQNKRADARQCLERAAAIYAQTFGEGHARTQTAQQALARVA